MNAWNFRRGARAANVARLAPGARLAPNATVVSNRLNFLLAIIFLLLVALVGRLFFLQVINYQVYQVAAANQHEVFSQIEPSRGKIFLTESSGDLYPLATNKDYLLLYAVPSAVQAPQVIANRLYEFFKRTAVEKEVEELLTAQAEERLERELAYARAVGGEEQAVRQAHQAYLADPAYLEAYNKRRQEMIDERRQTILSDYEKIFAKVSDPYEPIERKLEADLALQFQAALAVDLGLAANLTAADLAWQDGKIVKKSDGQELAISGINYANENYRYYLEGSIASHLLGFVALDQSQPRGLALGKHGSYGLEGFFDEELFGRYGSVKSERGPGGLVIVQDRVYNDKQDGDDLVLTLERNAQFFVDKVLRDGVKKYQAESGSIIVLKPESGEIVAMSSWPDFDPNKYNEIEDNSAFNNPVIFDQYEPGSVFKAITMAAALDRNAVKPDTTYNDTGQTIIEGWPKPIKNSDYDQAGAHGQTTMVQVLEKSLNLGAIFAMNSIGAQTFTDYVEKFGFGEKTGIELEGESPGDISGLTAKKIKPISAATASFGQGLSVTPLQMAVAFATLANGGKLMKPYLVKEIRHASGETTISQPRVLQQVISPETSALISGMLVNVVEHGHAKQAQVKGYYVAGKTGTAQVASPDKKGYSDKYNHTFVAFAPADQARFVVLVRLYNPRGFEYAEATAVPLAHQVIEFLLNSWQIPKNRN